MADPSASPARRSRRTARARSTAWPPTRSRPLRATTRCSRTLVTAVKAAGLVDTLNSAPALTVFAPTNDAFAKIPANNLNAVLADKATLTTILTNHVVGEQIGPDQLAGEHETLAATR